MPWYMVRLEYDRGAGPERFWWLSVGPSRRKAAFAAHQRFMDKTDGSHETQRLVSLNAYDLDWLDRAVAAYESSGVD